MEEECHKYRKEYQEKKMKINAIQAKIAASANTAVILAEVKKENEKLHKEIAKYKIEYQNAWQQSKKKNQVNKLL